MPQENSLVKFPSKGRLGQRGFTEPYFEEHLKTYFLRQRNIQFFNDRYLIISDGTIPYEPDFVLVDERDNLNLLIDIEIDEPYDGVERYAMHFIGDDEFRNQYFNDRGWIVIRFSEKQVHLYPLGCCRYIAEVIDSVNPKFTIPQQLIEIPIVNEEPIWTKLQAEKWAQENYRENYLKTSFSANSKVIIEADNLIQNETEREIERKLSKPKGEEDEMAGKLNELNRHQRDSRIIFYPKPHLYLIDGNPRTIPTSDLVRRFFNDFDSLHWAEIKASQKGITIEEQLAEWEHIRQDAANLGTELHLDIEAYFNSDKTKTPKNKKEFNHFLRFYDDYLSNLKPYRTEWRIFDDIVYVAGTADMVCKKDDGTYSIYDWKRSKEIKKDSYRFGFSACQDIPNCNYFHYSLQLNIYKKILEEYYAKPISEMYFVQLHPDFDSYQLYPVDDMQDTVDKMFETSLNGNG